MIFYTKKMNHVFWVFFYRKKIMEAQIRHAKIIVIIVIIIIIICVSIRCHSKGNEYSIETCSEARTTHSHGWTTP